MILAFLQNMWVTNPERVKAHIALGGEAFRLKFMRYSLFAGCKTGRVLKQAFGETLIGQMMFEETTREIAGDPRTIFPAQPAHMAEAIDKHRPKVVVTFGAIATEALNGIYRGKWVQAPHPAARHPTTMARLRDARLELEGYLRP